MKSAFRPTFDPLLHPKTHFWTHFRPLTKTHLKPTSSGNKLFSKNKGPEAALTQHKTRTVFPHKTAQKHRGNAPPRGTVGTENRRCSPCANRNRTGAILPFSIHIIFLELVQPHFRSLGSKDRLHPLLTTFGNLPFSGSLPELSNCNTWALFKRWQFGGEKTN